MNTATSIRALIIEDVEDDALLLVNSLQRAGLDVSYRVIDTPEQLTAALREQDWDIVYSDYTMPGFNGMEALDIIRRHDGDIPFIFVSGTIGEDRAVEAVRAGANDYILKGSYKRLPIATGRVLEEARIRREHRLAKAQIEQLINVDSLTGLASRGLFLESLHKAIEQSRETDERIGVLFLNVDRFRTINDGMGMKGGDLLIRELAARLIGSVSSRDLVARLYADQFAILVRDVRDDAHIDEIADRLLQCFNAAFTVHRYSKHVSGSLGIALFPDDGLQLQTIINNVTLAQTLAKQLKGNSRQRYSLRARKQFESRLSLEAELETAIRNKEFVMHFQPQINISDGRIVGVESLVRWEHPENGVISPLEFITLAEETGLILPLGEMICALVCRQIESWKQRGLPPIPVAINVSSHQFQQPEFAANLNRTMRAFGVEPERIELEITETALMDDPDKARATMAELRELGVKIALDDFGTGFSSMSYLDRFPIDILKIDRAFISDLPKDDRKVAIVNAILAMTDKLGMKVVAEGIETAEQLAFLCDMGCDMAQGYHIQRPADGESLLPVLMKGAIRPDG